MSRFTYLRPLHIIACTLIACLAAMAVPVKTSHEKSKIVLIVNSYAETAPWSLSLVSPISLYVANNKNLHAEMFSLNNVLITDSASYNTVQNNLFETYAKKKPDYLVLIGALAFTMRDKIVEHWGDIPILLICRDLEMAPLDYYFAGFDREPDYNSYPSIAQLQDRYNFTAVYVPDLYKETIDLMIKLQPDIENIAFLSDRIFLNRNMANDIKYYLYEYYPDINFKWVQASEERPDELQEYLVNDLKKTGILLSTWIYEKKNAFGSSMLVTGDLNLLNSSKNPIFTTRQPNMSLGAIGGVFANQDSLNHQIISVLDAMVAGKRMSDIRFKVNRHDSAPVINYTKLEEYGLNPNACPKDTVFIDKPLSFSEKYLWQIIATVVIFTLTVVLFLRHAKAQRQQIANLENNRRFITKMPVPFSKAKIIYDDQGNVTNIRYSDYNEAFHRIIRDNHVPGNDHWIFPNDYIAEQTRRLLESRDVVVFKYHFEKTDTYYIFTLCFVNNPSARSKDFVDQLDIFAIDVTEREKTQMQLARTTHRLDMALNVAHLIPWEWDLESDTLTFDTVNIFSRTAHATDSSPDWAKKLLSISGQEYISMIHADDRLEVAETGNSIRRGEISEFKLEHRILVAHDGQQTEEWVEVNGTVSERNAQGRPSVISGSLLVISDRKRQEQALIDAREKATESDKLKSAFLANMSHEIRTPLNAIVGFSSLMCETDDPAKRREFADIIVHNNDMLLSLVNDVLDLAKIESNTLAVYPAALNLNTLLNTVRQTVLTRVHNGVALNLVEGLPSCVIVSDGNRLSQVLMNLLFNATKFTTKGSITFGYDIVDNREIYFYVKDTGIGISPENQKRLFTRFDKINNFMQGNGLGLSICKSIVELLGGTIGMKSRGEGKGSTFWFTIPYVPGAFEDIGRVSLAPEVEGFVNNDDSLQPDGLEPAPDAGKQMRREAAELSDAPAADDVPQPAPAAGSEGASEPADASDAPAQPTILVAEDMEGNFLLLKHVIPSHFRILHAWDGQEAVELFNRCKPDIVLMDISMPVMDGYQATQEIRKVNTAVPIIAVTAFAYASDRQRILRSGFNDYVSKPVVREELIEAINRQLKR